MLARGHAEFGPICERWRCFLLGLPPSLSAMWRHQGKKKTPLFMMSARSRCNIALKKSGG